MQPVKFARKYRSSPPRMGWLGRARVGVLIAVLGGAGIIGVHADWLQLSERPASDFLALWAGMNLLFAVWTLLLADISPTARLVVLTAFVALQAGLHQLVRLDGFLGDGRPRWTWRWTPNPEVAAQEYSRAAAKLPPPAGLCVARTSPDDYPAFRGRNRDGHASAPVLATTWEREPPRLLWRRPSGGGWSSFAIVGDCVVTQEQQGEYEATLCCELATGRTLWAYRVRTRFDEVTSGVGPRATPTIDGGDVFSLGAAGDLACLDGATGQPRWSKNILHEHRAANRLFGVCGSPLVTEKLVIVNAGGPGSALAAYDRGTGDLVWQAGASRASYSSPHRMTLAGCDQVLDFNADGLFGHELKTGRVLWNVPWISNPAERNNVCQPVLIPTSAGAKDEGVFLASGYGMGCARLAIARRNDQFFAQELWRSRGLKAKFSSVVAHRGCIFGLDEAILTCVDLASGQRLWKGGRYGYGQLLLAGDLLLVQLETGEVALVDATRERFHERCRWPVLHDRTWNHPALAGRRLLVRNDREAACYELPTTGGRR